MEWHNRSGQRGEIHQKNLNGKTVLPVAKKQITTGQGQLPYVDIKDNIIHFITENHIVPPIGVIIL